MVFQLFVSPFLFKDDQFIICCSLAKVDNKNTPCNRSSTLWNLNNHSFSVSMHELHRFLLFKNKKKSMILVQRTFVKVLNKILIFLNEIHYICSILMNKRMVRFRKPDSRIMKRSNSGKKCVKRCLLGCNIPTMALLVGLRTTFYT